MTFVPTLSWHLYVYRKSQKMMGQKPNEKLFTVAPYFKVTGRSIGTLEKWPKWDVWVFPEKFSWGFCPMLSPDIYIYLGSHKKIMEQKPDCFLFRKKSCTCTCTRTCTCTCTWIPWHLVIYMYTYSNMCSIIFKMN